MRWLRYSQDAVLTIMRRVRRQAQCPFGIDSMNSFRRRLLTWGGRNPRMNVK
jgi:hypothetical protein